ncbi:MAG TPA: tetratricopeptide repeat protein [Steroidobacteraceae bacterium]
MLRKLLIFATLTQGAFAAPVVEEAVPGLPAVKVQDLHYGDVLFHFYQHDHFDALVRLAAYRDQGRLAAHARDSELLRGGLYLSLGQHREAQQIFERMLADPSTPPPVRDKAWFYLGKVLYAAGLFEESERALRSSSGTLPAELDAERQLLLAQGLMYRQRYDQAIAELEGWQGPRLWLAYGQFNLGVALVRVGQKERGLALLDSVGQIVTEWPELIALRDKANLAIGYAHLQAGEPAAARAALDRVRLSGPQSSKALLGAGWADAAAKQYEAALLPWQELQGRDLLDAAVQESYLAVPYAYAELGAMAQAVDYYEKAIAEYDTERSRIGESIGAIRSGRLLAAALQAERDGREGWFGQLADVPDSPESRYLYHLLAGHEFQEGLKNYRALEAMSKNLSDWSDSLGAFTDMVETRQQAFRMRLPAADARLATVDVATINGRRDELHARLEAALAERDLEALATEEERGLLDTLAGVDAELARHPGDAAYEDAREKARLARGVLLWKLDSAWKVRSWQANRALRDLNAAVYDARTRETASSRAREGAPERNAALGVRVRNVSPRVVALAVRVDAAKSAQGHHLADIAIEELEAQRQRLDEYSVQARYALATIYDRATADAPSATSRGTTP